MNRIKSIYAVLKAPFYLHKKTEKMHRLLNELNWANIFNNTVQGSEWFPPQSLSPGRSAIGYPVLYVMYRILDDTRPKNILEFGLGLSSNILANYGSFNKESSILSVEHDRTWVDFYMKNRLVPDNMRIEFLDLEKTQYHGAETLSLKGVKKLVDASKFDLILVDGPFGSKRYSRSQVLSLIPENINANHFCILLDDYDRDGEKETGKELERLLEKENIKFHKGVYRGMKDVVLYCSADLKFLATL